MDDKRDPPIEEPGFIGGGTVIDIGDVRVARGLTRRHHSSCPHRRILYDNKERRIWCKDCEREVESFDAFVMLVEQFDSAQKKVKRREEAVAAAETFKVRMLATKVLDEAWRSHSMVPACPHCGSGLFPEDFKGGIRASLSREYAQALVRRKNAKACALFPEGE